MNKQNQETTFKQSLKNTSIVVAIIMLLKLIKKLIFKFQETKEFFNEILFFIWNDCCLYCNSCMGSCFTLRCLGILFL